MFIRSTLNSTDKTTHTSADWVKFDPVYLFLLIYNANVYRILKFATYLFPTYVGVFTT